MKKIFIKSLVIVIGILAFGQAAVASSAELSVLPSYESNIVGALFDTSVQINPTNNKVCVVKGTLNLNNLSCQNITLASELIAQTMPTCLTPSFVVGIPKCATSRQDLFMMSVSGNTVGQASISLSDVKVIGVGTDISFDSQSGLYNIIAPEFINEYEATDTNDELILGTDGEITGVIKDKTFISGLTASVLDAFSSAWEYMKGKGTIILFSLLILIAISQVYLLVKVLKKKE